MPFGVVVDSFRNWLYVANAGSDDVSVLDLDTGLARANIPVGANPRGLILNRDNTFLFVHNVIDGTLSIIETSTQAEIDVLPISNPAVSNDFIIGAELFHSAADPRLSEDRWISCATCHFDGQPDGRTWKGLASGPRNTPPLYSLIETAPYNWTGTWDELQDVELKIRRLQVGTGLLEDFPVSAADGPPHAGLSFDLDLLTAYLLSLKPPSNPAQFDPVLIEEGAQVFESQSCGDCHAGASGTDLRRHDVGTDARSGEDNSSGYDTPTLRYLWMSAPYFHDGSAATLRDVFTLPGAHQLSVEQVELEALIAYLLSWS
jgi:YVTN family beta-propeller protein